MNAWDTRPETFQAARTRCPCSSKTNDIVYALAADGTITYVSPRVRRYGLSGGGDLVGRPFLDVVAEPDRERLQAEFAASMTEGRETLSVFRVRTVPDEEAWLAGLRESQARRTGGNHGPRRGSP